MLKEIRKSTFRITNAINNSTKTGKYDWISLLISSLGLFISLITIFVAIDVPKKIAQEQNSIALFEKRYEVFNEIKTINDFLDGYYQTYEKAIYNMPFRDLSPDERKALYYRELWEGEIHFSQYSKDNEVKNILNQQSKKIGYSSLLFEMSEDEQSLCNDFFSSYAAMTQRYVIVETADYYIPIRKFDENYNQYDMTSVIEKMEKQLELFDD